MNCIGYVFQNVSRFDWQFWCTAVSMDLRHRTSLMIFNVWPTSSLDSG
jgi:hypothetical protein